MIISLCNLLKEYTVINKNVLSLTEQENVCAIKGQKRNNQNTQNGRKTQFIFHD